MVRVENSLNSYLLHVKCWAAQLPLHGIKTLVDDQSASLVCATAITFGESERKHHVDLNFTSPRFDRECCTARVSSESQHFSF